LSHADQTQNVILVTGPSGAGRSTAINVLEDLGYEAIDNIPLHLIPRLFEGDPVEAPLVLGVDARNRDFTPARFLNLVDSLKASHHVTSEVLYVDCRPDILLKRFSETRRRHPLAPENSPSEGISREADLLEGVRWAADYYLDTSDMTPHDLRPRLLDWFGSEETHNLSVVVKSFSYKRGLPGGADMVMDCRFLRNPHWQKELRSLTGKDQDVSDFVKKDENYPKFITRLTGLVDLLLPAYQAEGKAHFSLAFGCTGGQHRSVSVAETVAHGLAQDGWRVSIRHNEMERRGMLAPAIGNITNSGE
jgi:UPF0042 nucleotide-binding protein